MQQFDTLEKSDAASHFIHLFESEANEVELADPSSILGEGTFSLWLAFGSNPKRAGTNGHPQAVRSKLIIATLLKRCSSGEEWWAHILFLCFGRGSKVVKCVWLRPKSLGFAGSTPALFFFFRCGVVGNMSGFHPVASGSIPGSGFFLVLVV